MISRRIKAMLLHIEVNSRRYTNYLLIYGTVLAIVNILILFEDVRDWTLTILLIMCPIFIGVVGSVLIFNWKRISRYDE